MTDPLIDALRGIVGVPHVLDSAPDMAPFLSDWRGRYHGAARAVVRPHDTAELAAVVSAVLYESRATHPEPHRVWRPLTPGCGAH